MSQNIWDDEYRPYGRNEGKRGSANERKTKFRKVVPEEFWDTAQWDAFINALPKRKLTPWDILGITKTVDVDIIKKAFRMMAFKTHPDHGGTSEAFRVVNEAYKKIIERLI
jgi:DnaJ-class molecular chaperone